MKKSFNLIVLVLLFLSGLCALVYQVGWLRELRLVFGGSTLALAVVLAIFMGGLGFGGLFWGRIADRHAQPLKLYAWFELGIALFAAASPLLLIVVRNVYIGIGGSSALGAGPAMLLRIIASILALGIPTFLMGGTLPAVARAVETEADRGRRSLALLYGINTIGAVCGVVIATFFLLETVGTRLTIWSGSFLNLAVGLMALALAAKSAEWTKEEAQTKATDISIAPASNPEVSGSGEVILKPVFIYTASFLVGFSFFVMEIVWNRMLTPLLGGSVYSYGLVIAVVLTGIGLGGWLYSRGDISHSATLQTLAVTLGLEALALAFPFALGDRLAVLAALLRPFGELGFGALVSGWTIIVAIVVLPASLVAGFQFPLLVNLLGRGGQDIGQHTGKIYAWNTFGAIAGLLAGGFGLIRLLSAPGCWQAVVGLVAIMGAVLAVWSFSRQRGRVLPGISVIVIALALLSISAEGPSAAWRHTPIGVGHVTLTHRDRNDLRDWLNLSRRKIFREIEGIESSIGLMAYEGLAFVVNGKVDGNATIDAPTQIMGPLIGAILHPRPEKALVIGLGTGASAGWLADIESVKRVDVMELEPAMLEVARLCSPANRNALDNRKVRMIIGDARESLMTSKEKYDIIFSEPSNPYRAGIASLYTREYYQAVFESLQPGGYFSQWVQAYDIDSETLYVIGATLATVFPEVEIWQSSANELIFVCSKDKKQLSMEGLRGRLAREPFKSALLVGWGMTDLEGFLAARLSGSDFTRALKERQMQEGLINSDDRMLVEFGFARNTGRSAVPSLTGFRRSMMLPGEVIPGWADGLAGIDWTRVGKSYSVMFPRLIGELVNQSDATPELRYWQMVYSSFLQQDYRTILRIWQSGNWQPEYPLEKAIIGEAAAEAGDQTAMKWSEILSGSRPVEAKVILGRYFWRNGEVEKSYQAMEAAFLEYRENPWPLTEVMDHALDLVAEMALTNPEIGARFYELLKVPFSVYNLEERRHVTLLTISSVLGCESAAEVLGFIEPDVPFKKEVLEYRQRCYEEIGSPLLGKAQSDLREYNEGIALPFTGNISEL